MSADPWSRANSTETKKHEGDNASVDDRASESISSTSSNGVGSTRTAIDTGDMNTDGSIHATLTPEPDARKIGVNAENVRTGEDMTLVMNQGKGGDATIIKAKKDVNVKGSMHIQM